MLSQTPGQGQAYLACHRDVTGSAFDGAATYRLRVPPDPPAKQFWSVTLYDLDTRCLIQNEEQIAARDSRSRTSGKRGRVGGPVLQPGRPGGFYGELDPDRARRGVVRLEPP